MNSMDFKRSPCAIANMLDILGDKWSLLVIRDLFFGKTTYSELQASIEKIPSNILAQRLKHLLKEGLIQKQQYQNRPVRYNYSLTKKGHDLTDILQAILAWGNKYFPGTYTRDQIEAYREQIRLAKIDSASS
ncbi:MAG: winged helix-turn-helix transcriptional regulator [Gammaproteobacteria bacterium]